MEVHDEVGRLDELHAYDILDTPAEAAFDDLTRLAALLCAAPTALVTLVDEDRQWFKSRHGFAALQTERAVALCAHVVESRARLVISDTLEDPRFARNPLVAVSPRIRFYAGIPLVMPSGFVLGTLAVIDYVPRHLEPTQLEGLAALARQVVAQLVLRRHLAEKEQQRREDAERFELVARATNDAVWDWDLVTNRIWWSEGMRTLFGYPPEDVPTIDTWTQMVHPEDEPRVTAGLYRVIGGRTQFWSDTYRYRRHDGRWADILDRGYVLRDADDKPVRMIGAMLDVTERRQLEEQVRQSQKMDAVGQLSGGIAHDFNNLLTVIQVNAALLSRGSAEASTREQAQAITEATQRAAALTRQLLMVSRRQIMQPRVVDLDEVVSNLSRMLRRVVGEHITFAAHTAVDLAPVHADVGMLEQVLLNLVVNARDAMPRGGQLTIMTGQTVLPSSETRPPSGFELAPGPYVWIAVSDSGTGIAPEHLPHIFEPFFTTKDVGRGTGLGLATAYGIVRQHRGWIEVDSEVGRGTRVCFYLPATVQPRAEAMTRTVSEDDLPGGTETVLVVEDEHALRGLVVKLLTSWGYTVLEARSGVAALDVWTRQAAQIDLVVTDIVMPEGLSGRELAERLRAERPTLPVVFTSGYSPELAGGDEQLVDGVNFLQKPYPPARLARVVRACLDASRPALR